MLVTFEICCCKRNSFAFVLKMRGDVCDVFSSVRPQALRSNRGTANSSYTRCHSVRLCAWASLKSAFAPSKIF